MTFKPFVAGVCVAAVAMTAATGAFAQAAPAAAPAAPVVTHGPPITGVCVFSVENAVGASTVGKYVQSRLQQIVAQANAELTTEKNTLDSDAKAIDAQRATLDQSTFEQRAAAIQVRGNALQRKAQLRDREVSATEQKALGRIGQEMDPLIQQVYQQRGCSILIQRNSVIVANPAMDITPQVITALNAKITQFAFDRERLDQAGAVAPSPGAAPPIVQTPAPAPRPPVKK